MKHITKHLLLILLGIGISSCSVLNKKDTKQIATTSNSNITKIDTAFEDTTTADISKLGNAYYSDNTLSDSIWKNDEALLLKDLSNDEFISAVDSAWMNKIFESEIFDREVAKKGHRTNVKHEPDSIIKARLEVLNTLSPMDLDYNPIVKSYINTYLYKRASQMERMMGIGEYYFPMFEEVLDRYNIPLELKYLAVVESALNPRAKSRVGAAGLWQFMYSTGKIYNLKVSSYVDERFDPYKETIAAAEFMTDLYKMFGDWNLVLAAYNSGPGNVRKAIRRSGGHRNFWYIRPYLPRETRGYVPAFIAVNYAMHYATDHNLVAQSPHNSYYQTDTLTVKNTLTFAQISEKVNVSKIKLEALNPSYKHNIIPFVKGRDYKLVLPISNIDEFVSQEDSIYAWAKVENKKHKTEMPKYSEVNSRIRHKVRSGEVLGSIANKYGVRVSQIKKWNKLRSNNIRVGQRLTIYPRKLNSVASSSKSKKKSSKKVTSKKITGKYYTYTVKNGDSLWLIAKKYPGVSAKNIQGWNGIGNSKTLKPGMKLKIAI